MTRSRRFAFAALNLFAAWLILMLGRLAFPLGSIRGNIAIVAGVALLGALVGGFVSLWLYIRHPSRPNREVGS